MLALNAAKIDGDQALELKIGLLAAKVPQEHIFGRDRRVGLEFETPVAVLMLTGEQGLGRARDMALERLRRRRHLRWIESDVHGETFTRRLGAVAPGPRTMEAAL